MEFESPQADGAQDRDWGRHAFGEKSQRVAFALVEAMLSDEDGAGRLVPAPAEHCRQVVEGVDISIGAASRQARRSWRLGLWLVEFLPLLIIGRPRRMSHLPLSRRVHYLEQLEASRFGLLAALLGGLKVTICIHAFEQPQELASTGFDRPHLASRRKLSVVQPERTSPAEEAVH
jgi:hypothetical protein